MRITHAVGANNQLLQDLKTKGCQRLYKHTWQDLDLSYYSVNYTETNRVPCVQYIATCENGNKKL